MKLYLLKQQALDGLKENLQDLYGKYYSEASNKWMNDICGVNPFMEFKEIPKFRLAELDSDLSPGEIDLENCKILYENLKFLTESQACDERFWAGLTHTIFYEYMRKRWKYGYGKKPKTANEEASEIKARFFYKVSGRSGFYRNTLSKCWWIGHNTYDPQNNNHFEMLDIIGSNDFNSKVNELFHNFTFSSNPYILSAIIDVLRDYKNDGIRLDTKKHIRPALSNLNAVGGSVLLDCLSKEEIKEIFSDTVTEILQGDIPTLNIEEETLEEADRDEESEDENGTSGLMTVTLGCKIKISNNADEQKTYLYDLQNGKLPDFLKIFNGCQIGDSVEIRDEIWTIEDITL